MEQELLLVLLLLLPLFAVLELLLLPLPTDDDDDEPNGAVGGLLLLKLVLGMAAGFDELELLVLLLPGVLQLDVGAFVAGAAIFCPFGSHGTAAIRKKK